MKKLILALTVFTFFAVSCENTSTKSTEETKEKVVIIDEIVNVSLVDYDSLIDGLAGRKITISGTVDHVCKHGGQKMFIVDENTDTRVKITPNDEIAAFNTKLVGETVKITGIVEEMRVDEDYLKEWEEEVKQGDQEEDEGKGHGDGKGHGEGNHESADAGDHDEESENLEMQEELEQIANMRKRVQASEKGYLSFYSILALEYRVYKMD